MAVIICIETSTTNCSVALSTNGKVTALREVNNGYTHAENITLFIDSVLTEADITFESIHAVAVSKGPGSYTGLRIGVSAAKGLCMALNVPLISVDTLYAMAWKAKQESTSRNTLFCPMIDARRMEVYAALFNNDLETMIATDAIIIDGSSFSASLQNSPILFFGDGAMKCKERIIHPNAKFIPEVFPTASALCPISERYFNEGRFEDMPSFEPFYLKDFIAGKGSVLLPKS